MRTLIGITGSIGSGKSTLARLLTEVEPHSAVYEVSYLLAELGNHFNIALKGELALNADQSDTNLVNQAMIWFAETLHEELHFDVTWNQLAIAKTDIAARPEIYEKLFVYLKQARHNPALLDTLVTPENKANYRALLQWFGAYIPIKTAAAIFFEELLRRADLHDPDAKAIIIPSVRLVTDAEYIRQRGGLIVAIERPNLADKDATDPTEQERRNIKSDILVKNNGTLHQLTQLTETLWNDILAGAPKTVYDASK